MIALSTWVAHAKPDARLNGIGRDIAPRCQRRSAEFIPLSRVRASQAGGGMNSALLGKGLQNILVIRSAAFALPGDGDGAARLPATWEVFNWRRAAAALAEADFAAR
jgi:hypothetical protein